MSTERPQGLETATAVTLIAGLAISLTLLVAGVAALWASGSGLQVSRDPSMFLAGEGFAALVRDLLVSRSAARPAVLLMSLGIVTLILTPYVRVLVALAYFARKRDLKYLAMTALVLAILTLSLVAH